MPPSTLEQVEGSGQVMVELVELLLLKNCPQLSNDTVKIYMDYLGIMEYGIVIDYTTRVTKLSTSSTSFSFQPDWEKCDENYMHLSPHPYFERAQLSFHNGPVLDNFQDVDYHCEINIGTERIGPTTGYVSKAIIPRATHQPTVHVAIIRKHEMESTSRSRKRNYVSEFVETVFPMDDHGSRFIIKREPNHNDRPIPTIVGIKIPHFVWRHVYCTVADRDNDDE